MTVDGLLRIRPSGRLIMTNSTLTAGMFIAEDSSEVTIQNGVVNAGLFSVETDAVASGVLNGNILIAVSAASITASNDLTLGGLGSDGFVNAGVLDCGAHTVTIIDDPGTANINTARLNGGRLVVPNGGEVSTADSLYGTGTVDGDIENNGKIVSTGAGLTFEGIVSGVGQGISGTVVNFANGGGFTGDGQIEVSIAADSTSVFTLTGGLILGDSPFGNDFELDGAINAGAHTLNIIDVDTAELGGVTTLDGGTVFATNMLLRGSGAIQGRGTVNANFVGQSDTRITPTGPLSIGNSTTIEGFGTAGRIEVGAHTLTINTDEFARLGRSTTIAGGLLTHSGNDAFYLEAADTISGFGTVSGGIRQGPGSVIRAEGALTIGTSLSGTTIFPEGGLLDVNSSAVTLLGVSASNVSSLTTIAGGSIASTAPVTVLGECVLRGFGTIDGSVVNTGTIEVGAPIGVLTVTGDLDNATDAAIAIQVGGAGNFDRLVVDGRLDLTALGGGTLRIGQIPGLVVSETDTFSIISGAPLVGQFDNIVFDDPYLGNLFDIWYTPTQVFLVAKAATGVDLPPAGDPSGGAPGGDGVADASIPEAFRLRLVGANPASLASGTRFEYEIPRGGSHVSIAIFDASGRVVSRLIDGAMPAGRHPGEWHPERSSGVSSGVYFLRMESGAFRDTKRVVMLR